MNFQFTVGARSGALDCFFTMKPILVAALAFLATYAFFCEYLSPLERVHIFSDIEGFHYPLQRYAFQSLKEGRFPQWDPSIYCGISFVANVQAAALYPPSWLMYAASWRRSRLKFKMLEYFVFVHVWLGFVLCYLWLRGRRLTRLASAFGAGVFAYGGYMISQCVHVGSVTGLTWMPLGLWGIDDAVERRDWRPLWKTALASALCFLAGYPASWLVFCSTVLLYALASRGHWRAAVGACAALAASGLLAAMQWLPAVEASASMFAGEKYGGGALSWQALIRFFLPNWFDMNRGTTAPYPDDSFYVYLGLPALFAIALAARGGGLRRYFQPLLAAGFCLLLATNPNGQVYQVMVKIPILERSAQSYNFYEGIAAMAALCTALSLDGFLRRETRRKWPGWLAPAVLAALAAWGARQLWIWWHGGRFAAGMASVGETAAALALFAAGMWVLRAASGAPRVWLAAALLLFAAIDYKVFGTNRRFNTIDGDVDQSYDAVGIRGVNRTAYWSLWRNRDYRLATDAGGGPNATDFRMWGLAGPQGFDPFLPAQYREFIEQWVKFRTNREFHVDFANQEMLQALGVRYVITHEGAGHDPWLAANPDFRRVGPDDSFYRVYEFQKAKPPFGWVEGNGEARPTGWLPERRTFQVRSAEGGRFFLGEQFLPGWSALVDGRSQAVERWNRVFQATPVGPGEHTLVFRYRSRWLLPGAGISLAASIGLAAVIAADRRKKAAHPG